MIEYYKQRAKEYEKIYDKPERQQSIKEYKDYLTDYFKNGDVLELACGTGFWTEPISFQAKSIKATDINQSVIEIAKAKKYRSECKVVFEVMDYKNNIEYLRYNCIFAGFLVSHLSKMELNNFINELVSKSKNQRILIMDNNYIKGESTDISRTDINGNTFQIRKLEDGSKHEIMKNFYTNEDLIEIIENYKKQYKINRNKYFWSLEINT